ncbi:hypothetical protein FEM08_26420 [Flavobacterium gilvum]|nr:hypothetical protein FEM08_26420 [Flavobacterium gilvum]
MIIKIPIIIMNAPVRFTKKPNKFELLTPPLDLSENKKPKK